MNNKEKDFAPSSWAINNSTTMYVVMALVLLLGINAYFNMPREEYPEIKENIVFISSIYPGNTAEDVEKLITEPLEDKLKSVNNILEIKSSSKENFSLIIIEFDDGIGYTEAKLKVKDEVESAVASEDWPMYNNVKVDPNVFNMTFTEEMPIVNINISGDYSTEKLKEYSEILQDEIESLNEIKKVDISGALEKEVEIAVDIYKMMASKVSFYDIINSIQSGNISISAGNLKANDQRKTVRIIGEISSPSELENFVVKSSYNNSVLLRDIAEIKFKEKEVTTYAREKEKPVVMLVVKKRSGENTLLAVEKIRSIVEQNINNVFPKNLTVSIANDQSELTENQVTDLVNSIIFGVVIVVLVLLFFLGFKNALFVGIAIPMSMFMSLAILGALGNTLNTMILFGLILGLGMLVDNAVVVVENVYRLMEKEGMSRIEATKRGISEIAFPIIISTATTVAAFIPLGLWPGRIGKFMVFFPVTLSVVLCSSLFVAVFFNSVLVSRFMKIEDTNMPIKRIIRLTSIIGAFGILFLILGFTTEGLETAGFYRFLGSLLIFVSVNFWFYRLFLRKLANNFQSKFLPILDNYYEILLKKILVGKRPYLIILSTFISLVVAFMSFGKSVGSQRTSIEFFPDEDPRQIIVYVEYPEGTDISKTNKIAKLIEADINSIIYSDKYYDDKGYNFMIQNNISQVGEGTENPDKELGGLAELPNRAKITTSFRDFKYRQGLSSREVRKEIQQALKNKYPGVSIAVEKNQSGPPVGYPINIEITGENYSTLIEKAEKITEYINTRNIPGIEELKIDVNKSRVTNLVNIDREKAGELGLSVGQIGQQLRAALFGTKAGIYKENGEDYDINIRFNKDNRYSEDILYDQNLTFRDPNNGIIKEIPISSVTSNSRTTTFNVIKHKDFKRIVTIYSGLSSGYVDAGAIVNQIVSEMKSFNEDISMIDIDYTGQIEEQNKNQAFLLKAFGTGLLLIFLLLILQFNSISKPTIIMIAIILSLIGVFGYLAISGNSFVILMTMMGIIALSGIVVNNGVVLLDYSEILLNRKKLDVSNSKKKLIELKYESIVESCKSRLRPVLLTAITTIGGLVPLSAGFNINFYTLFSDFDPNIYWGGDNFVFWGPLATTVISGLVVATFLTLFVVPSLFMMIEKFKLWIGLRYR